MTESSINILLIEDDNDDVQMFSSLLYRVTTKVLLTTDQDGPTACRLLKGKECHPQYVFLDLNLPVRNGLEFPEKIRSESLIPKAPIIVHSGHAELELRMKCAQFAIRKFVKKSANQLKLTQVLREYFEPSA